MLRTGGGGTGGTTRVFLGMPRTPPLNFQFCVDTFEQHNSYWVHC